MKIILAYLIILTASPTIACGSAESGMLGVYNRVAGSSDLVFLDLFFEDGGYIFNARTAIGNELIGSWSVADCELRLLYTNDDGDQDRRFSIESHEEGLIVLEPQDAERITTYVNPVDGKEYTSEWETYEPESPKDDLDSRVSIENVVLLTSQEDLAERVSVESLSTYIEQLETYLLELAIDSNDHGKVWLQVEIEQDNPPAYQMAYDGSVSEELLQAYYERVSGNENVPAVLGPVSFQLVMVVRDRSALSSAIKPE